MKKSELKQIIKEELDNVKAEKFYHELFNVRDSLDRFANKARKMGMTYIGDKIVTASATIEEIIENYEDFKQNKGE